MNTIEISLAADQNYFCGLLVTVVTMARTASRNFRLRFHILDGGICPSDRDVLESKAKKVHPEVLFHWISVDERQFDGFPPFLDKSRMTYARLLLPSLLPDCDFLIYCDVDFIWTIDVAELWALRREDIVFQCVRDGVPEAEKEESKWFQANGFRFRPERYFCAGLCFFNLKRFREDSLDREAFAFLEKYHDIRAHDQTTLNAILSSREDVVMLPDIWQFRTAPVPRGPLPSRAAIHFAADAPWRILNYTRLLTDLELFWFQTAASIKGISTWKMLRRYYSRFQIVTSRLIYLIAACPEDSHPEKMPFGCFLLKICLSVLGRQDAFAVLAPLLRHSRIPWKFEFAD